MKKNSEKTKNRKPVQLIFLISVFFVFLITLLYVGLKLEIERLTKEKALLEESLLAKKNKTTMLLVEVQRNETEERISQLAESKLGMVKFSEPNNLIEIDSTKLDQITKIINSRYEQ
ncbi:MAG: hypothetical protein ACM3MI_08460 [Clostridiales bacterium]